MPANDCLELYRYLNSFTTISSSYDLIEEVGTSAVTPKKYQWTLYIKDNALYSFSPSAHRFFSKYIFSNCCMGIVTAMSLVAFVLSGLPRQDVLPYSWLYMFAISILWLCPIPWLVVAVSLINKQLIFEECIGPLGYRWRSHCFKYNQNVRKLKSCAKPSAAKYIYRKK